MTRFDSLAIARQLTDAGIERAHADATRTASAGPPNTATT